MARPEHAKHHNVADGLAKTGIGVYAIQNPVTTAARQLSNPRVLIDREKTRIKPQTAYRTPDRHQFSVGRRARSGLPEPPADRGKIGQRLMRVTQTS